MSAVSTYRDAVLDDGCYVLRQVVNALYEGEELRPDIYCRRLSKNYFGIFNHDQRKILEQSGLPDEYDIEVASYSFDVSLLVLLAEHMCGLESGDKLLKKVEKIRKKRNSSIVAHPNYLSDATINESNLNTELNELQVLYIGIIEELERRTIGYCHPPIKQEIKRRIREKKLSSQPTHELGTRNPRIVRDDSENVFDEVLKLFRPSENTARSRSYVNTATSDSDEIPTWGKVALGVTAGIAALGLAGAMASGNTQEEEERRERRRRSETRNNNKEECVVM